MEPTISLATRIVGPDAIVNGRVRLVHSSRRHQHIRVEIDGFPTVFIKTAGGDAAATGVERERTNLQALLPELRDLLPEVVDHEGPRSALVLRFVHEAKDLRQAQHDQESFGWATPLGTALARVHETSPPAGVLPIDPRVLDITRPGVHDFAGFSPAALETLRIIQDSPAIAHAYRTVLDAWHSSTLIHGDLRWDNVLVGPGGTVTLVDWETASIGDPEWDVGNVLAGFMSEWIAAREGPLPAPPFPDRRNSGSFIQSYCDASGRRIDRERLVLIVACRLAAEAVERCATRLRMTRVAVLLLQAAENIATAPARHASVVGLGP